MTIVKGIVGLGIRRLGGYPFGVRDRTPRANQPLSPRGISAGPCKWWEVNVTVRAVSGEGVRSFDNRLRTAPAPLIRYAGLRLRACSAHAPRSSVCQQDLLHLAGSLSQDRGEVPNSGRGQVLHLALDA
jgi:hypothetical protein